MAHQGQDAGRNADSFNTQKVKKAKNQAPGQRLKEQTRVRQCVCGLLWWGGTVCSGET